MLRKNIKSVCLCIVMCATAIASYGSKLSITRLTGDYYIYTTWHMLDTGPYPANGMYMVTTAGVVLFDTPWDTTQVQPLLDSIAARHHKKVVLSISTHFHEDRTGSINILKRLGVRTYSSRQTQELCRQHKDPVAEYAFINDTTFTIGGKSFSTYYPGAGHAPDNIVIWCAAPRILYGGCFIKSTEAHDLGNLGDADAHLWEISVKNIITKYPHPQYIIPGHLEWNNTTSLEHTLKLLQKANSK